MKLTPRCIHLLRCWRARAGSRQRKSIAGSFPDATLDAARKRLRKLTAGDYLLDSFAKDG